MKGHFEEEKNDAHSHTREGKGGDYLERAAWRTVSLSGKGSQSTPVMSCDEVLYSGGGGEGSSWPT